MPSFFQKTLMVTVLVAASVGLSFYLASAGPTCTPPNCPGAVATDAQNNLAVGTTTTAAGTKFLVLGSSTDANYFAVKVNDFLNNAILWIRNDGRVSIATSSFSTTSTVWLGGPLRFQDGTVQSTAGGGTTVQAQNVSNVGYFGQNTGGGNYAFPAKLSVGTSTVGTGDLYVVGNVGIATSSPTQKLEVVGNVKISGTGNALMFPDGTSQTTAGGGGSSEGWSRNSSTGAVYLTTSTDKVGIGTSTPQAPLSVGDTTSSLVGIFGGGSGKIDVGTIDPIYTISSRRYATYVPAMTGQKEETVGVVRLEPVAGGTGKFAIDFRDVPEGSDLWLFGKVTGIKNNFDKLAVLLTPGFEGAVWYKKDAARQTLTIFGSSAGEVSYRLTAPRFDAAEWPNRSDSASPGFILNE